VLHGRYDKIDLPVVRPVVTRVERYAGHCPCCGGVTLAPVPVGMEEGHRHPKGTAFVATYAKPWMFLCSADRGRFSVPTCARSRRRAQRRSRMPAGHRVATLSVLCAGHVQQFGGESPLCNLMEVKHE
jgi:hypothetical protein